jgi:hypothetical protein
VWKTRAPAYGASVIYGNQLRLRPIRATLESPQWLGQTETDNGRLSVSCFTGHREKEMQTRVSHWLRDQERKGLLGGGTTLHGLRVSYAA